MAVTSWNIHKFGGSSLKDAGCIGHVAKIVGAETGSNVGVVVSAMGGMTDQLLRLCTIAERDDRAFESELIEIGERYAEAANRLVHGESRIVLLDQFSADGEEIRGYLEEVAKAKSAPEAVRDIVSGHGELWSARLMAAHLEERFGKERSVRWLDARNVITVRHGDLGPAVLWDRSKTRLARELPDDFSGIVVITGFIASDEQNRQTTLGRNGSDYSAAIFAALTDAEELTIWTDVDGVLSADPRQVPDAQVIENLSYNEAMELAYFGASVLHPQTLGPVIDSGIPVTIRNTFEPDRPGSRITGDGVASDTVKGITAIDGMSVVNLEGSGMIGVPGTADRMFGALKDAGVSVTLISQASSEHSICVAVPSGLAALAIRVIREAFAAELDSGQIASVDVDDEQSIVAVVGDGMAGTPGLAAKFLGNLGRTGINVRAIAQGSSERNISVVVDSTDVTRALRAVHSGFYLSAKTLSIGIIGPGTVGGTLLDQVKTQTGRLNEKFNLDLRIRAIARSKTMLLASRRVELGDWRSLIAGADQELDYDRFEEHVNAEHLPHAIIIDCSASDEVAGKYAEWLRKGIHVITPNKKAFSGSQEYYDELRAAAALGNSHFLYETTVGAALPISATIRDLIDTGDRIETIEGILSGTLAYLFNVYDGTRPFSEIVAVARESGYTEPDPRDDLSGMDVARKLTILAREMGLSLEIGDFPVENLIPEPLRDATVDEFLAGLADYDAEVKQRYDAARAEDKTLRYVARLTSDGKASVGLEKVPVDNPFSKINLTDNIVQFKSDRYAANPLVIQGPGAGPEVTAGGVFGDLLKLATILGDGSRK